MNGTKAIKGVFLKRVSSLAVCALAGLVLTGTASFGQSTFASILGTVHDASGAVVANCVITVENKGTSARRSSITDQRGNYAVENLEPGHVYGQHGSSWLSSGYLYD